MSENVVTYKPMLPLYILLFALLVAWTFLAVEVAQYSIVTAITTPSVWISSSVIVLLSLTPFALVIALWIKSRVTYNPPDWNFQVREIVYDEFDSMMNDYVKGYSHIISRIDPIMLLIVALSFVLSCGVPLLILSLSILLAAYVPFLFGALVLVYGLALAVFSHRLARNSASVDFPLHSKSPIRAAIQTLSATPGISWAGVRLSIGEAGGYYTIRSPTPVARIEAIEGSVQIEMKIDNLGQSSIVAATVVGGDQSEDKSKEIRLDPTTAVDQLASLVKWSVTTYLDEHGSNEFVEELIEDLGIKKDTF
ncbi:MAG: hypothetical protein ACFE8Z_05065 [Candidatus Hermodarchaeota archaeon]